MKNDNYIDIVVYEIKPKEATKINIMKIKFIENQVFVNTKDVNAMLDEKIEVLKKDANKAIASYDTLQAMKKNFNYLVDNCTNSC